MKVLFVLESPKNRGLYLTQLQPLGVLYMASYLESKGIKVDVIDYNVETNRKYNPEKYDLIGFSATSGNLEGTMEAIKKIKSQNKKTNIVLGGPLVSLIPEKLISHKEIDALFDGESEDILFEYLHQKKKTSVKGLWIKKNAKPYFTGKRQPIQNLDILPFPALEKVPFWKYNVAIKKRQPVAGIITSRGCPYGCIFCHHALGYKYRTRSPENVITEIERDIKLGIKELWIADDNFTHNMDRVEKICDLIKEKNLDITFTIANGVRADKLNENLLNKLKKAGCWLLTIAPESGNEESLKKMYKGFTLEHAVNASKLCKKIGIKTMSNFIIGFPWEKKGDMLNTIDFAKKLDSDITHFSRLVPYPGTPLWKMINGEEYLFQDEAHNYGGLRYRHPYLTDTEFVDLVRKAYRDTMLNPRKIWNLFNILKRQDFFSLAKYAIRTNSI